MVLIAGDLLAACMALLVLTDSCCLYDQMALSFQYGRRSNKAERALTV